MFNKVLLSFCMYFSGACSTIHKNLIRFFAASIYNVSYKMYTRTVVSFPHTDLSWVGAGRREASSPPARATSYYSKHPATYLHLQIYF